MAAQRVGGTINFKIDGVIYDAKGNFTYNIGRPKREAVMGTDGVHGYKETPQVSFIEGEITDRVTLNLDELCSITDSSVSLELANGKLIMLSGAWFAGDGTGNTDEGNIGVRFEAKNGEEVT